MTPQERYEQRLERARISRGSSTRSMEMRDMQRSEVVWTSGVENEEMEEIGLGEVKVEVREEEKVKVRDAQNEVERMIQRVGKRMGYNVRFKDS